MNWQDYQLDFEFDGSWRDLYVLNTTIYDWQRLIDFLRSSPYLLIYKVDFEETSLPQLVEQVFTKRNEASPLLSINIGSVILNCHFFTEDEIEFDIDPREIVSAVQSEQVFAFMRHVGQLLNKEVILTPENEPRIVIFRFVPSTETLEYISSAH